VLIDYRETLLLRLTTKTVEAPKPDCEPHDMILPPGRARLNGPDVAQSDPDLSDIVLPDRGESRRPFRDRSTEV
jgi:hypothetical protein